MNFLIIDPSMHNVGFAILQINNGKPRVLKDGTLYPDRDMTIQQKAEWIFASLQRLLLSHGDPCQLIIEYPAFMGGVKGMIASQKGYTIDLAAIVGYLAGLLMAGSPDDVFLYTPMQWKGTKPKTATIAHLKRVFPTFRPHSEHSADAVDLGLYHFRKMKYIK